MELKEYLQIVKKYQKAFFVAWGGILFLSLFTISVQPVIHEGEKTVLIVRGAEDAETIVSEEYDYHYQLEADERLAEILVQFLEDKSLLSRSFNNSNTDGKSDLKRIAISKEEEKWIISKVKGEALGGGYVKITISSHSEELIGQVSNRLVRQLENKISKIGTDKDRLLRLESEPVYISQKNKLYLPVGLGAFFGGLLVAIFVVLGIHYWREEE
jgi:hypothetical protein